MVNNQNAFFKNDTKNLKNENDFGLPSYGFLEEVLNYVTHGAGVIFSVFAFIFLLIRSPKNPRNIISLLIYSSTLFILYLGSTLYHVVKTSKLKSNLRKFDHCSIFLLIAGTYTPICAIYLNSFESNIVLAAVWVAAIVGMILNMIDVNKFSKISLFLYIFMGWSVLFISKSAMKLLSKSQLIWLLVGGILYTLGAVIYVIGKKIKYMHSVWHLFVLAGSVCHFMILV